MSPGGGTSQRTDSNPRSPALAREFRRVAGVTPGEQAAHVLLTTAYLPIPMQEIVYVLPPVGVAPHTMFSCVALVVALTPPKLVLLVKV